MIGEPRQPEGLSELCTAGTCYRRTGPGAAYFRNAAAIHLFEVGTLRMPTGQLVAAAPSSDSQPKPFTATVPRGDYPVVLSILDRSVAAARLVVSDEPVATWELARQPGQDGTQLGADEFFEFSVDDDIACFYDGGTTIHSKYWESGEELENDFLELLDFRCAAEFCHPESSGNIIAFRTAYGESSYPTWIGRTADGSIACFVADMMFADPADIVVAESGFADETLPSAATASGYDGLPWVGKSIFTVIDQSADIFRFSIDGGPMRSNIVRVRPRSIVEWAYRNRYTINARGRIAENIRAADDSEQSTAAE